MSIEKRGDRYRVRVTHNGSSASGTRGTHRSARTLEAELRLRLGAAASGGEGVTVGELAEAWAEQATLSDTYRAEVVRTIGRIPETLAARPIAGVSGRVLELVYRELAVAGWKPHACRRLHEVLGSAFARAVKWGWLPTNPARDADKPAAPARSIHPPDDETVNRIVAGAAGRGAFGVLLELSAWTGAREGEVVGLQWGDVLAGELIIRRSLSYTGASGVTVRGTKTGESGQRRIALQRDTSAVLDAWRGTQQGWAAERGLPAPVWVISDDGGCTPWPPYRGTSRFHDLRLELGISGVRLHDLRHHHATALLGAGVDVHVVADRLGDDVDTVRRVYRWYLPAVDRDAIDRLRR